MASHAWILLCCVLLPTVQGIDLSMVRFPGQPVCGRLQCKHDVPSGGSKCKTNKITIYDVSQSGTKLKVASFVGGEPSMVIDPTRISDISGTATITQFHADMSLELRSPTDCMYVKYQCDVEYISAEGKKEVVRKILAPEKQDIDESTCTCSSIKYQFQRLTDRTDGTSRRLSGLSFNQHNQQQSLAQLRNDSRERLEGITRLRQSNDVAEQKIINLQEKSKVIDGKIDALRHADSVIDQAVNEQMRRDQAQAEDTKLLKDIDAAMEKQLNELQHNNKLHYEALNTQQLKDSVTAEDINQLTQKYRIIEADRTSLSNEVNSMNTEINELKKRDATNRVVVIEMRNNDKGIQQAISCLKHNDSVAEQQLADVSKSQKNLDDDVAVLEHTNIVIAAEITQLGQNNGQQREAVARLSQYQTATKEEIRLLENKDAAFKAESTRLSGVDTSLLNQLDAIKVVEKSVLVQLSVLRKNDTVRDLVMTDLKVKDRILADGVDRLTVRSVAIESELTLVRQSSLSIETDMARLTGQVSTMLGYLNPPQVITVTKTTTKLVQVSCTKNMVHDKPTATVILNGNTPVLCDTETDHGGWIYIQKRTKGDVDFNRGWNDYKTGFGSHDTDFWLGNELLHIMTSQEPTEMRIDLIFDGKPYYAQYSEVKVAGEPQNYKLTVSGYRGTAGDAMIYHNQMMFSTFDRDNDMSPSNCAATKKSGWWFNNGSRSNLNGLLGVNSDKGALWKPLSEVKAVSASAIKIRFIR